MLRTDYVVKTLSFFDPHEIANSGQAFRIRSLSENIVELVALNHYLQIASLGNGSFAFSCSEEEFNNVWFSYFSIDIDYKAIHDSIDKNDNYLMAAALYGQGIRILRQDSFEAIISYIISQRRSIKSISTAVDKLSEEFGQLIDLTEVMSIISSNPAIFDASILNNKYYSFPTIEALSAATIEQIASIGVGYRAPYILEASRGFFEKKYILSEMRKSSDDELYEILTSMYGVGAKVANCSMLFGFERYSRFPIDVWMKRILDKYYGGSFDISRYPETAGIMQQFMFYYERTACT